VAGTETQPAAPPPAPREFRPLTAGDHQRPIRVAGTLRRYTLHIPAGYDPQQSYPAILVLHGRGSSASLAGRRFGFSEAGDRRGYLTIYPEALPPARTWFTGIEAGVPAKDDVAFVQAILEDVAATANLDAAHVYAAGYSSGGTMAAHLAGRLPGRIRAIAAVDANIAVTDAGGALLSVARPAPPVSALFINGRTDRASPYAGGWSPVLGRAHAIGAREGALWWAQSIGCAPAPRTSRLGEIDSEQFEGCPAGAAVHFLTYPGGHDWPKSLALEPRRSTRPVDYIMDFFQAHG
jgi:polyhydroxybutyrate depolymerase